MTLYAIVSKYAGNIGMSISALERKADLGNGTIRRWDKSNPNIGNLERVSKIIGVETWQLLKESKNGEQSTNL